jgi:putative ABC transport system permease protein
LIVGVDFAQESKIKGWWEIDGAYPHGSTEVVVGSKVAEKIGISAGSRLHIGEHELRVAGVLRTTGSQDDSAILAPMSFVESLLGKPGRVSLVEVSALCSDCPIDELVRQISAVMPNSEVQAVRQVMEQRMQVVRQFARFAVSIFAVLTVMCGLFIFATIAGAVTERRREIGVMRAIGFTKIHIVRVVLSEAFVLSVVAGGIGVLLALPVLRAVIPQLAGVDTVAYDPEMFAVSFLSLIVLALLSAVGPAVKASRFDPIAAIGSL